MLTERFHARCTTWYILQYVRNGYYDQLGDFHRTGPESDSDEPDERVVDLPPPRLSRDRRPGWRHHPYRSTPAYLRRGNEGRRTYSYRSIG